MSHGIIAAACDTQNHPEKQGQQTTALQKRLSFLKAHEGWHSSIQVDTIISVVVSETSYVGPHFWYP